MPCVLFHDDGYSYLSSSSLQKETIGDLVIVNGQLGHAGTYTCMAQTVVDNASASVKLVVRGKGFKYCECMHIPKWS